MKLIHTLMPLVFLITFSSSAQKKLSTSQIDSLIQLNSLFIYENPHQRFELAKKIYSASKSSNYELGIATSLYKISIYHSEILTDYKKALAYNDEGTRIAKKIKNDSLLLYFNFGRATVYGKLGFHKKADSLFDACLIKTNSIANITKRKLFRGDLFTYKAGFLSVSKPTPDNRTLLNLYIKAMDEYEQVIDKCINPGYTNVGTYYRELKEYDKATYYLKRAIAFFKMKNIITCEIEYTNLSDLYYKKGEFDLALSYLDSSNAICLNKADENYYLISKNYQGYKKIYKEINNKDSIIKYQNFELAYNDSLNLKNQKQLGESANYIISKRETENKTLQKNSRTNIAILMLTIISLGTAIALYYRKKRKILQKLNLQKEKELKKNLEDKATEIQLLKQKISSSYDELIMMAMKDNPLFVSFFKEIYPEFYRKLKVIQPDLTILEQKICFYLKLKLSTREIADFSYVSIKAIQTRKSRLRKRLFIEDGKDIYDWIDELDKN